MKKEIVSHYRILGKLGEGGMGIIYKAEDQRLKRNVVLKILSESFTQDEESKKRFINEAQAASSLQHNNICTIHEIDETEDGVLFIAMDYYEGETLKIKISHGLISISEIIEITRQIAEGLNKAHQNGIIHRDIKPANIFINSEGIVKILDFGLAKKKDQTQFTRMGVRFGTTEYMSPEQIKGEKVDNRTDIWSLGALLYEMLTGQRPFQADYEQAVIYLILNQDPEDVRKFREHIPEKLLNIVERSLAKNREDRYEDLECFLEDLNGIADREEKQFQLPAPKPSQSIAVLPFVNMSTDPEQESFCDGLTEELINTLSRVRDLKVVARTSAFSFRGGVMDVRKIGRKLDVSTVLEGSVRKSGEQLRITVQLINVLDGYHLWSERYDRDLKEIFKIQDEISLAITDVLKVKLLETEKTTMLKRYTDNLEAYNFYQQGWYFFNQLDLSILDKSIKYFNQALELDPDYALAYCGLAGCYFAMSYFGLKRSGEVKPDIKRFIQKALEIDENLPEAYHVLGLYEGCMEFNQEAAASAYRRSLELNPNSIMALQNFSINRCCVGQQFDLARKLAGKAKTIDPLSDYVELCVLFPEFYSGRYEFVIERLLKFQESDSTFWWGLWFLWRALSLTGRRDESLKVCKNTFLLIGMNEVVNAMESSGDNNAFEAAAYVLMGIYKIRYISPYNIATLLSHAGKQEEALLWLQKAMDDLDPSLIFLYVDPEWESVRDNDQYKNWIRRIGFHR